jgi:hypothetical protein
MDDMDLIQLVDDDELDQRHLHDETASSSAAAAVVNDSSPLEFITSVARHWQQREQSGGGNCPDLLICITDDQLRNQQPDCTSPVADAATNGQSSSSAAAATSSTLSDAASRLQGRLVDPPQVYTQDISRQPASVHAIRIVLSLAIMQIVVALLSVPIAAVAIAYCAYLSFVGHGLWTAVLCAASGVSVICAWHKKSVVRTVMHVTMTTIAAVCSALMASLAVYSAVVDSNTHKVDSGCGNERPAEMTFLIDVLLSIVGCIELLIGVINASIAFKSCCTTDVLGNQLQPPGYCESDDTVMFDGVHCRWTRHVVESPYTPNADGTGEAPPPPYTLPPYTPRELPPAYK